MPNSGLSWSHTKVSLVHNLLHGPGFDEEGWSGMHKESQDENLTVELKIGIYLSLQPSLAMPSPPGWDYWDKETTTTYKEALILGMVQVLTQHRHTAESESSLHACVGGLLLMEAPPSRSCEGRLACACSPEWAPSEVLYPRLLTAHLSPSSSLPLGAPLICTRVFYAHFEEPGSSNA